MLKRSRIGGLTLPRSRSQSRRCSFNRLRSSPTVTRSVSIRDLSTCVARGTSAVSGAMHARATSWGVRRSLTTYEKRPGVRVRYVNKLGDEENEGRESLICERNERHRNSTAAHAKIQSSAIEPRNDIALKKYAHTNEEDQTRDVSPSKKLVRGRMARVSE